MGSAPQHTTDQQTAFEEAMRQYRDAPLEQRVEIAAHYAKEIILQRNFFGVQEGSEMRLVRNAVTDLDLPMLHAFITYAPLYQVGCISHALTALRENGTEKEFRGVHVAAASTAIRAVVEALRSNPDLDLFLDKGLEGRFREITSYAIVHHAHAEVIASLIMERKVHSLDEMLGILNGMTDLKAAPLSEGFL